MDARKKGRRDGFLIGSAAGVLFAILFIWSMAPKPMPEPAPGCVGFSQIKPVDWNADSSGGKMFLSLINDAGENVRLDSIDVQIFSLGVCSIKLNKEVGIGESYSVDVSGCILPEQGDYYKSDINITYTSLVSGVQHRITGYCYGAVR